MDTPAETPSAAHTDSAARAEAAASTAAPASSSEAADASADATAPAAAATLIAPAFFELESIAGGAMVDCFGRLRMSELLNIEQTAATLHADALGVGREVLVERLGAVWMIAKTRVRLDRPVRYGEVVRARTNPVVSRGATLPRETELFVAGERVASAHTIWVLASLRERRLLRPSALADVAPLPEQPSRFDPPARLRAPEELRTIATHRVSYSELDMNRHLHNTKYLDIAADALRLEELENRRVCEFSVNFSAECVAGEVLTIEAASDGDRSYLRGVGADGVLKFEVELVFADA